MTCSCCLLTIIFHLCTNRQLYPTLTSLQGGDPSQSNRQTTSYQLGRVWDYYFKNPTTALAEVHSILLHYIRQTHCIIAPWRPMTKQVICVYIYIYIYQVQYLVLVHLTSILICCITHSCRGLIYSILWTMGLTIFYVCINSNRQQHCSQLEIQALKTIGQTSEEGA